MKLKNIGIGALIISSISFFIVAGTYMNQVSVNASNISSNKESIEIASNTATLGLKKSNEALKASKRAIESNSKVSSVVSNIQITLNEISTAIAVSNQRDKTFSRDIKEIKEMVKKINNK